jgi:hypothetical protein
MILQAWQAADGAELYPDSVVLGALFHSIYGTQGFQAFRFPPERRNQMRRLLGVRGELAAFVTCVMERESWQNLLVANAGIQQGEAPSGAIRPRSSGSIADTGYLRGDEEWTLSAQDFTDLCALSLAHRLEHNECNRTYGPGEKLFAIMAAHLGGTAEREYKAALAAIEAAREAGQEVAGGYSNVSGEAEPKLTEVYEPLGLNDNLTIPVIASCSGAPGPCGRSKFESRSARRSHVWRSQACCCSLGSSQWPSTPSWGCSACRSEVSTWCSVAASTALCKAPGGVGEGD